MIPAMTLPTHRPVLSRRARRRAFTLVELLLVLVILGTLAALVLPKFTGRTEQARVTAAITQISTFGTALDAFEVDTGGYPRGSDGGPYLKSDIPPDPWGHPYLYECPGKLNPSGYDIISMGPDGQSGTADDITNGAITAR